MPYLRAICSREFPYIKFLGWFIIHWFLGFYEISYYVLRNCLSNLTNRTQLSLQCVPIGIRFEAFQYLKINVSDAIPFDRIY